MNHRLQDARADLHLVLRLLREFDNHQIELDQVLTDALGGFASGHGATSRLDDDVQAPQGLSWDKGENLVRADPAAAKLEALEKYLAVMVAAAQRMVAIRREVLSERAPLRVCEMCQDTRPTKTTAQGALPQGMWLCRWCREYTTKHETLPPRAVLNRRDAGDRRIVG